MIMQNNFLKLMGMLCFFTTSFTYAHGSLTKRIKEKTVAISKNPKNADLYFDRGYLYEQHEEYNKAITDYLKSEKLGNSKIQLQYRKAQTYYSQRDFSKALESSNLYLAKNSSDVKINKLQAQILTQLGAYDKAIKYYDFFIENAVDANPEDFIEYSKIYLAIGNNNYPKAIEIIEFGLKKLGNDTFSLQERKLEYLESSNQIDKAIEQYNYFILSTKRTEFWYYNKAKYLFENKKILEAKIALQQAKSSVLLLTDKFQKTEATKALNTNINDLENKLYNEK